MASLFDLGGPAVGAVVDGVTTALCGKESPLKPLWCRCAGSFVTTALWVQVKPWVPVKTTPEE